MSREIDAWGDEQVGPSRSSISSYGSTSGGGSKAGKPDSVRDDWEADDDEEGVDSRTSETQNKQIWEEANAKESRPMPSVIVARGSAISPNLPLNQPPTVRILKRPSVSASQSSANTNASLGETLQEREARYQAARERIFGTSTPSDDSTPDSDKKKGKQSENKTSSAASSTSSLPQANKVLREPRGPASAGDNTNGAINKGFGNRKPTRPPNSRTSSGPVDSVATATSS